MAILVTHGSQIDKPIGLQFSSPSSQFYGSQFGVATRMLLSSDGMQTCQQSSNIETFLHRYSKVAAALTRTPRTSSSAIAERPRCRVG